MEEFQAQTRVTQHFDHASKVYTSWYDLPNPEGHSFRIRRTRCLEALSKLPHGTLVVDAGCGPGTFVEALLDKGFHVLGTDIAPGMIEECRKRFADKPHAAFDVSPADAIPLQGMEAGAITAMGLLEYLNDETTVLREFRRVLKPGGLVLLTYPHKWSPTRIWNRWTHALAKPILFFLRGPKTSGVKHREYELEPTLQHIRDAGFEIKDVIFYNMKLGFRPLDAILPRTTVWIAEHLERFCRTPLLRKIGTGFIVVAKKPE